MMYNLENNIHCVPYLGWLLTQVLHSQTYKKLQDQREVVFRHRSSSLKVNDVSKRKSWRESACTISLPSSPIQSEDESEEKETKLIIQSNTSQPSCDNILITRCFSDTNINTYDSESATRVDTPVSPHGDIDFGFPTIENYSVKNSHKLHPLAVNNNMTTQMPSVFKRDFEHQTSSDSSVDESNQTDSAIGLDSSIGQPSPAHEKPKENQIKLSNYVNQHLRSESINSFFTGNDDEYCLPSVDSNFEEDESDDDDDATDVFHVSFTETSDPYSYSPSHSLSPLSLSIISLSLISEPNTPVKGGNKRRITLPDNVLIYESFSTNAVDSFHPLLIPICGLVFSSSPHPEDRLDDIDTRFQTSEDQLQCLQQLLRDDSKEIGPEGMYRNELHKKFSINSEDVTLLESSTELVIENPLHAKSVGVEKDQSSITSDSQSIQKKSTDDKKRNTERDADAMFVQYQKNALNYLCDLTSRSHVRYVLNNVPWIDETKCHEISVEMEPLKQ